MKKKLTSISLVILIILGLLFSSNPIVGMASTASALAMVSSDGTIISYVASELSSNQISGNPGTGVSTGAVTPVIPANAITFGNAPESIIGTDNRIKVNETTTYPYRTSALIVSTFPNGVSGVGSGNLISPDTVLTAGHCVYDPEHGGWATVKVYPGYNGTIAPFGMANSTEIHSVSGWINGQSSQHDIAAIKLDHPIGDQTGWLGVADMTSGDITITGYPGEKGGQMYTMSGAIASVTTNNTYYTIDTTPGNSGSGVYNNSNKIVAVHAYGGAQNRGTRINSEKLGIINEWIDDYGNTFADAYHFGVGTFGTYNDLSGAHNSISGTLEASNDVDMFGIHNYLAGEHTIFSSDIGVDVRAWLYDSAGNLLTSNDDGGGSLNFKITYNFSANSTYYLKVSHYSQNGSGSYRLNILADDVGNTMASALPVSLNSPQRYFINYKEDVDFFKFTPTTSKTYRFHGYGQYENGFKYTLYSGSTSLATYYTMYPFASGSYHDFSYYLVAGQTYYIKVEMSDQNTYFFADSYPFIIE